MAKEKNIRIFNILRDLFILNVKIKISRTELLMKLNLKPNDANFYKAINLMLTNGLAKDHLFYGKIKLLEINNTELDEFIRKNSIEFNKWGKFIEKSKPYIFNY
jgi:hypothetical protein